MKNNLFILAILLSGCSFIAPKPTKVTGVVTYFFNENYGQKPDLGGEVYFLKDEGQDVFSIASNWIFTRQSPHYLEHSTRLAQMEEQVILGKMEEQEVIDSSMAMQEIEMKDRSSAEMFFKGLMKDKSLKCAANQNGEFSININPGKYYIMVVFSHRDGLIITSAPQDLTKDVSLNYEFKDTDMNM